MAWEDSPKYEQKFRTFQPRITQLLGHEVSTAHRIYHRSPGKDQLIYPNVFRSVPLMPQTWRPHYLMIPVSL